MMLRLAQAAVLLSFIAACSGTGASGTGGSGGAAGGGSGNGAGGAGVGGGAAAGGGTGGGSAAGGGSGGGSATGGGSGGGFVGDAGSWTCDIAPVINTRCLDCHSNPAKFGAPMPLVTYQDTQANSAGFPGKKIFERMAARVADNVAPMPQPPNQRLTAAQITAFQNWAAGGGQLGSCVPSMPDGGSGDGGVVDAGNPDDCPPGTTEYKFVAPAFTIPTQTDFYQCFATTVTGLSGKQHMVKATKVIDDARVLHHMVLFKDLGKNAPLSKGNCGIEADWQVQYAWAPGAGPMETPADVGLPISNGDQLVIQIHYNNATSVVGLDSSGAKLCLSSTLRTHEGGVLAVGPTKWTPDLPPNCPKAEAEGSCTNLAVLNTTYSVFTVWPHMHLKGRQLTSTIGNTVVTSRLNYSFGSQYLEPANFQFKPGETMKTKCRWDTTGVTTGTPWGEDTAQEMCFNFLYVWPAPPVAYCPSPNGVATCVP